MTDINRKDPSIQIMRGIAIIAVLLWHAIAQMDVGVVLDALGKTIICFHMPVFFVIAGYLFEKGIEKYRQRGKLMFLGDKAKHLLLPYAFWTVLLWTVIQVAAMISPAILAKIGFEPMGVAQFVYGLFTYQVYYTEHLWFLYVLFAFFVINILWTRTGSTALALGIWSVLGFATIFVSLPHILERIMLWGIFFAFGRYAQKNNVPRKIGGGGYSVALCTTFIVASILRLIGLNMDIYGNLFAVLIQLDKYLVGFAGVGLIFIISQAVSKNVVGRMFKVIGDYSFDVYLMHNPYCVALSAIVLNKMLGLPAGIDMVISTALGVGLPMVASKLMIRRFKPLAAVMIGK